jgi:hypothetical protein
MDDWGAMRFEICLALSNGRSKTFVSNVRFWYTYVAKDGGLVGDEVGGISHPQVGVAYVFRDRRKAIVLCMLIVVVL